MKKVGTEISNPFSLLSEESSKITPTPSPTEQDVILTGYNPKGLKLHHLATSKDKLPATTKPKLRQLGKSASEGDVTTSSDWVGVETPKAQEQKRRGSSAGEREVEPRAQAGLETAGRPLTDEDEEEPVEYTLANSPPVDYNLINTKDKTRLKKEKLNQKGVTILGTKRIFDRRSATGRSLEIKKAGAGGGNWGKVIEPDLVEIVEAERNPMEEEDESERFGMGETEKRPDQLEYLESAAREENREELSYDEYMKQLEERKPKIAPPKPREPLQGEQGKVAKTPIHKSVTAEKAEQESEKKQGEKRERKRSTPKKETIFLLSAPSALPQQQHELQEFQLRQQKEQEEPREQQPSENQQQSEQQQQTDKEMKDIRQRLRKLGMQEPESQLQQQTPPAQQQQQPEQQKFSDKQQQSDKEQQQSDKEQQQSDKEQQQTEQQQKTEEEMQDIRQQLQKLATQEPGSQQGLSQEPRQQGLSQQEQKDLFPEQKGESFAQRHSVPGGEQMGLTREQMGGGQRQEEKWDQKQEAVPLEQVGVTQQSSTPQQREITQAQQPEGRRESGVEFSRGIQNPQPTESQKKETFTSFLPSSPFNDETTQL